MDISKKRAILFNGPPGSGKDTAAVSLRNALMNKQHDKRPDIIYRPVLAKFADPLKMAAHVLFGIPQSTQWFEEKFGHDWKDEPCVEFYGHTPRSVYINLSENFCKEQYGEDFFGKIAARNIQLSKIDNTFIFSDSGFVREAIPIVKLLGVNNVLVLEMERPGHTFANDSRAYIGADLKTHFPELRVQRIPNAQDKNFLRLLMRGVVSTHFGVQTSL